MYVYALCCYNSSKHVLYWGNHGNRHVTSIDSQIRWMYTVAFKGSLPHYPLHGGIKSYRLQRTSTWFILCVKLHKTSPSFMLGSSLQGFGVEGHNCGHLRSYKWYTFGPCQVVYRYSSITCSCCSCFLLYRIVNSELSHFKSALSSLENTTAFGSTLFDVWTVNR